MTQWTWNNGDGTNGEITISSGPSLHSLVSQSMFAFRLLSSLPLLSCLLLPPFLAHFKVGRKCLLFELSFCGRRRRRVCCEGPEPRDELVHLDLEAAAVALGGEDRALDARLVRLESRGRVASPRAVIAPPCRRERLGVQALRRRLRGCYVRE